MTLSLANQQRASVRLQDKTMEALYLVRFLATKRNKLRVRDDATRQHASRVTKGTERSRTLCRPTGMPSNSCSHNCNIPTPSY